MVSSLKDFFFFLNPNLEKNKKMNETTLYSHYQSSHSISGGTGSGMGTLLISNYIN